MNIIILYFVSFVLYMCNFNAISSISLSFLYLYTNIKSKDLFIICNGCIYIYIINTMTFNLYSIELCLFVLLYFITKYTKITQYSYLFCASYILLTEILKTINFNYIFFFEYIIISMIINFIILFVYFKRVQTL
jgi:hypothetical protein